jgi:effector-binding domain-containing protein
MGPEEGVGVENLVPIGRFSKMTRLSVKALRHYDEIGLLVPAAVDPSSGYRYYTYGQANRAEAIRVLRSLDMPLEDVREALAADDPQIAAKVLDRHRGRLEAELGRHERMLVFLGGLIERKEGVMPYEVQIKDVPAQHLAVLRKHTSMATIGQDVSTGFASVGEAVGRARVPMAGPPFLVMFDVIDEESEGDVEIAFPVAMPFPGAGEVIGREEPAMTVASTTHRGPYDEVGPAYHTITGWIQEHGHEIAGPPREIYLSDPSETPDPADYVTEIQFPIR